MMRLPVIEGLIRRRLLVNFRADPEVIARLLPHGFRPKLHRGFAIAGICLIRLEGVRPKGFPQALGIDSENAAHRIAVLWNEETADGQSARTREGVYIPRRDTGSVLNALAGGRLFPGEHHHSRFEVEDDGATIRFSMQSAEPGGPCAASGSGGVTGNGESGQEPERVAIHLEVTAAQADRLPASSIFANLAEASAFFEGGCVGYSATCDAARLDGIELRTARWEVRPLDARRVHSSYFLDPQRFPPGSIEYDHTLIMREIPHEWHSVADYAPASAVAG